VSAFQMLGGREFQRVCRPRDGKGSVPPKGAVLGLGDGGEKSLIDNGWMWSPGRSEQGPSQSHRQINRKILCVLHV